MTESRAVRIPLRRGSADGLPIAATPPEAPEGPPIENRGGRNRARRTFLAFLIPLVGVYAAVVALLLSSPLPGPRTDLDAVGIFTGALVGIFLVDYQLTIRSVPLRVRHGPSELVVVEGSGRERRFSTADPFRLQVLKRYPAGPLGDEPTELVTISPSEGASRTYLVDPGLLRRPEAP